jgi:hypothetical protein
MPAILSQTLLFCILISFLSVGFLYKGGPKTIKEYALGNGNFGTCMENGIMPFAGLLCTSLSHFNCKC